MRKSFCEVLLQYYPGISEVEDLYSTPIANCIFISFFVFYHHHVEHCNNPRDKENFVVAKDTKTLFLRLAVSDVLQNILRAHAP